VHDVTDNTHTHAHTCWQSLLLLLLLLLGGLLLLWLLLLLHDRGARACLLVVGHVRASARSSSIAAAPVSMAADPKQLVQGLHIGGSTFHSFSSNFLR
jgi:hypothetical protein